MIEFLPVIPSASLEGVKPIQPIMSSIALIATLDNKLGLPFSKPISCFEELRREGLLSLSSMSIELYASTLYSTYSIPVTSDTFLRLSGVSTDL